MAVRLIKPVENNVAAAAQLIPPKSANGNSEKLCAFELRLSSRRIMFHPHRS
jgi:hypothetical protein